ncbi:MAG TPA: hypothetical protein PK867_08035 [Pirellulales bacterium]|nr:hypothetical protein [Pirellulales bacterium]
MGLAEDFARFADELRKSSHQLFSEISFFPSGALSMRIHSGSRLFDLDFFPAESRFGVDELEADAGFNTGYRFSFSDFEAAKAKMLNLLEGANVEHAGVVQASQVQT